MGLQKRVSVAVKLKARFWWSDKSFTEFLVLLKKMLPENNTLSKNHYEVRRFYVLWEWSTKKSMHALMIAYYIEINLQKCISGPHVGYHDTKSRITNALMM